MTEKNYARGARHPAWKGGRTTINGYAVQRHAGHPRADANGYVYVHVLIAEAALGKHLRSSAHVHHFNGDKQDNRPANLVVCDSNAYHALLHIRTRARQECGRADWRKCAICGRYDDPQNLYVPGKPRRACTHRACHAAKERRRRKERAL